MKGQNRILPIKSLLENLKQESKKQYLHHDQPPAFPAPQENTPSKIAPTFLHAPLTPRDHHKGISLNKTTDKNHSRQASREIVPAIQLPFPPFLSAKKENNYFETSAHFPVMTDEPFPVDPHRDRCQPGKTNKPEQIFYQSFRPREAPRNPESRGWEESCTLTEKLGSKCEEETRHNSRMESHSIFKDEITKVKTELFRKEALLFEKTQEAEEKERTIMLLRGKLELGDGRRERGEPKREEGRALQEQREKVRLLEEKVREQAALIGGLETAAARRAEELRKYEEDNASNYILINLKLRQHEAEEREWVHQLADLREKERRSSEHQERSIKSLKEVLRQREEAISRTAAQLAELEGSHREREEGLARQVENKEAFIRELSAEVGDLKNSLRNMELRIREMIEEEEESSRIVEDKSSQSAHLLQRIKQYELSLHSLAQENESARKLNQSLSLQAQVLNERLLELEEQVRSQKLKGCQLQGVVRQLTAKLAEARENLKDKESLQESTAGELKGKITELNAIISKRENSLISLREKNSDLQQKLKKAGSSPNAPPKVNHALMMKENQRLSMIAKALDSRLYESFSLNQSLNQEVVKRELIIINTSLERKYKKDIE